ncbi:MAG: c-type cytochrome biogenesis protein CcmI [Methylobacteriaceae bacterium]|nr:c-type cytochrome biogenesis protein CcmI [Methylobacteriaceae bacterium]
MIWVIFAAMTGLAVFSVLWPLSRSRRVAPANLPNISLYEAQVAEIDRDAASGLIPAQDAAAAKADAARRLLAVSASIPAHVPAQRNASIAAAAALVLIPALTLGLYSRFGRPDLPDAPLAARLQATDPGKMDMAAAIVRIEAHLREHPDDGRGWNVIAPVYLRLGRVGDARRAFSEAIRLLGDSPVREAGLGEALLAEAQGVVTAEARRAFEKASADPSLPQPRYYLGLAALQDGKPDDARAIWTKLADEAPAGASFVPALRQKIAALGGTPGTGPQSDAGKSIAALPPGERTAAIRSMVDGLSARLQQNGGSLDEWQRLVRAYSVLNEPEKARAALANARNNLASDAAANSELDRVARELGLGG